MSVVRTITVNGKTYKVAPTVPSSGVTLLAASWVSNDGVYSQVVELAGVTSHTKVDLQPTPDQDEIFRAKTLAFVAENDDGVITVFSIGAKPLNDYIIQVTLTEVEGEGKIRGNTVGVPNPQADWDQNDPTKADYIKNKPTRGDWFPTIAEIGAAPAGFGLGVNTAKLTNTMDCDTAKSNGWYLVDKSANNTPFPNSHCAMRVDSHTNEQIVQTAYCGTYTSTGFIIKQRFLWNNAWEEWEFINPPMLPGVEYRTTERYNCNPVYVKMVELGNLPNTTIKDVDFYEDETVRPISVTGQAGSSTSDLYMTLPSANSGIELYAANYKTARIVTNVDRSNMVGRATVKYWKTTG